MKLFRNSSLLLCHQRIFNVCKLQSCLWGDFKGKCPGPAENQISKNSIIPTILLISHCNHRCHPLSPPAAQSQIAFLRQIFISWVESNLISAKWLLSLYTGHRTSCVGPFHHVVIDSTSIENKSGLCHLFTLVFSLYALVCIFN